MKKALALACALWALCAPACARTQAIDFDLDAAHQALARFLATPKITTRLSQVDPEIAARIRALDAVEANLMTAAPGSVRLEERARDGRRWVLAVTYDERQGDDVKTVTRSFTLVQVEGAPRVLWLEPLINAAWGRYQRGEVREAREALRALRELNPDDGVLLDRLGWCELRFKDLERAADLFERAHALMPERGGPVASLGAVRYEQGRYEEAEARYREALRVERTLESLTNLGKILSQRGALDDARAVYEEAIALDAGHPAPRLFLAALLRARASKSLYPDAESFHQCLEHTAAAWPRRDQLQRSFRHQLDEVHACCLWRIGKKDEALTRLRELARHEDATQALTRAVAYLREHGASEEDLKKIVRRPAPGR
jgi:tetratricopeptide (TPR) repeat protein